MSTVGIKEPKDRLTHYFRRTKIIALIQGIQSAEHLTTQEARLARLAAQGLVTLPTRKSLKRTRPIKVSGPFEAIHLASAVSLQTGLGEPDTFIVADDRLLLAAQAEQLGFLSPERPE